MRTHTLLSGLSVLSFLSDSAIAALSITATADNRAGNVSAWNGRGDPVEASYNIDPGQLFTTIINFNQCVTDGNSQACLNAHSNWIGLGPGNATTGFTANATLSATKAAGAGHAISDELQTIKFKVGGLGTGVTTPFAFLGMLDETGTDGAITFVGPGVNLSFTSDSAWNQTLSLANGEYVLTIDMNATLSGAGQTGSESLTYNVTIQQGTALCGTPGAESCFFAHGAPMCNDAACCGSVCAADSFCCAVSWDSVCVGEAVALCVQIPLTSRIINPSTGHRYVLTSPKTWAICQAFAAGLGGELVTVNDGIENEWLRRNLANNVPGLPAHDVWLGLTDQVSEGTFVWESGQQSSYLNWILGEPNNQGNEDFVTFAASNGDWNDLGSVSATFSVVELERSICGPSAGSCFLSHGPGCNDESCCHVVCELDSFCCDIGWDGICVGEANSLCAPPVVAGPFVNPSNKHRYYVLDSAAWSEAQKTATSLGGYLAIVRSAAENEWIRINVCNAALGTPIAVWIGRHDEAVEGAFQTVNGEASSYTKWNAGEPNNDGDEDYAQIASAATGKWNDLSNTYSIRAVVEVPCVGDVNGNGSVGGDDLGLVLGAWNTNQPPSDLNLDGNVDASDLAIVLGSWGTCPKSSCCDPHGFGGCDQPGCTQCVCEIDPVCCEAEWDGICVSESQFPCGGACQCGG